MDDVGERLRRARLHAGYKSSAAAARAFGWPTERYKSHENGGRGIKRPDIIAYARALRVDPEWLLFGRNPPRWLGTSAPAPLQPLGTGVYPELEWQGAVSYCLDPDSRGGATVLSQHELSIAAAKPDDGVFFLRIKDKSMFSTAGGVSFDVGDLIACNPSATFNPGDFVIAIPDLGSTDPILRRLQVAGMTSDGPVYSLVPLNPDYPVLQVATGPGKLLARVIDPG